MQNEKREVLEGLLKILGTTKEVLEGILSEMDDKPAKQAKKSDTVTFETIRKLAIEKSRNGQTEQVHALLADFKINKISELKEPQFKGFHERLVAI